MRELGLIVIVALIMALIVVNFVADRVYKLSAFEIKINLHLSKSSVTIIDFPPIGKVKARTHLTPINLIVSLEAIYQDRLKDIIDDIENKEELINLLYKKGRIVIQSFIIRLLLLGAFGGIVGALLIRFDRRSFIIGLVAGLLVIGILVLVTYYTYDLDQFNDPQFEGMLEAAPWMMGLIEEGLDNIEQLGYEMELIASNMSDLFSKVDTLQPLGRVAGDLKVLHVSDIHNNPVALQFIIQIAKSFDIDMIIDTGDITDFGTPLEGKLLEKINDLNISYIVIPGNHDSPEIVKKLNSFSNVIVLDEDVINIKGLIIAGIADPAAKSSEIAVIDEEIEEYSYKLEELVNRLDFTPDIVAVHQVDLARFLFGKIPLLLHGHDHSFKIYQEKGTTVIDAGTTGAAGLRGFKTEEGIPSSVALLHYNKNEDEKLILDVVDIIKFYSRHSGFILERKLIEDYD